MAAGIQPFEEKRGLPKLLDRLGEFFLPESWFQARQRPIKGEVSKTDVLLARKLLASVEMEIKDVAKSQGGVSRIDQVSRVAFPLAFFFFNGVYWFVYLSHQSHEVAYRLRN